MITEKKTPQLFEYSIFWLPNEDEVKAGKKPAILVEMKRILSNDEKSAFMSAVRSIPKEYAEPESLDQVQIALRPF